MERLASVNMSCQNRLIDDEKIKMLSERRAEFREKRYAEMSSSLDGDAVSALREYFDIFDERLYLWIAGLYDSERGAFYYSNSARESMWYLPDIESTVQLMRALVSLGLIPDTIPRAIPDWLRTKLVAFAQSLQDSEDGYFYHEQWGKEEITTSRRGRDLYWCTDFLRELSAEPLYPTPIGSGAKKAQTLPEHLASAEAFGQYLSGLDIGRMSYHYGNLLQSQAHQIRAAGEEFVDMLFSWLGEHQRADNGLWQEEVNYASVNGLMKITLLYSQIGRPVPNAIAALKSAIRAALSDEPLSFVCEVYNPLVCIQCLLGAVKKTSGDSYAEALRRELKKDAASLLRVTAEKIKLFGKDDGTFSYHKHKSASRSQGAPIAPAGMCEGDANATSIVCAGMSDCICSILGIGRFPIYTYDEGEFLFELMEKSEPVVKRAVGDKPILLPPEFNV